jgi:hypothetical protein
MQTSYKVAIRHAVHFLFVSQYRCALNVICYLVFSILILAQEPGQHASDETMPLHRYEEPPSVSTEQSFIAAADVRPGETCEKLHFMFK